MKSKIKRIIILLMMGLLVSNVGFAETWVQFLSKSIWRLQNPNPIEQSLMFSFTKENGFISTGTHMNTGQMEQETGTYNVSGSGDNFTITITLNGTTYSYTLEYVNEEKIVIGEKLIFAKLKSSEDHYPQILMESKRTIFNTGPDINFQINQNSTKKSPCQSCNMTGKCGGCNGTGKVPGYPYGTQIPCRNCGGTGTCNWCKGTGYVPY